MRKTLNIAQNIGETYSTHCVCVCVMETHIAHIPRTQAHFSTHTHINKSEWVSEWEINCCAHNYLNRVKHCMYFRITYFFSSSMLFSSCFDLFWFVSCFTPLPSLSIAFGAQCISIWYKRYSSAYNFYLLFLHRNTR